MRTIHLKCNFLLTGEPGQENETNKWRFCKQCIPYPARMKTDTGCTRRKGAGGETLIEILKVRIPVPHPEGLGIHGSLQGKPARYDPLRNWGYSISGEKKSVCSDTKTTVRCAQIEVIVTGDVTKRDIHNKFLLSISDEDHMGPVSYIFFLI